VDLILVGMEAAGGETTVEIIEAGKALPNKIVVSLRMLAPTSNESDNLVSICGSLLLYNCFSGR
jgi:hypothetical protein